MARLAGLEPATLGLEGRGQHYSTLHGMERSLQKSSV